MDGTVENGDQKERRKRKKEKKKKKDRYGKKYETVCIALSWYGVPWKRYKGLCIQRTIPGAGKGEHPYK